MYFMSMVWTPYGLCGLDQGRICLLPVTQKRLLATSTGYQACSKDTEDAAGKDAKAAVKDEMPAGVKAEGEQEVPAEAAPLDPKKAWTAHKTGEGQVRRMST